MDAKEEAVERAGRTIAVPVDQSLHRGPQHVIHQLVLFDGLKPTVREPQLALDHDGWAPPRPIDYCNNVRDIRSQRARNLYAEDEKDLHLESHFWHPFHFYYYDSILYHKYLKKMEPPVV